MGQHKGLIFTALGVLVLVGVLFFGSKTGYVPLPNQMKAAKTPTPAPTSQNQIIIENGTYSPTNLIVKVGSTVDWTNKDIEDHTVTADDNSFDTGLIKSNQSGSLTFDTPGTYSYHCTTHPEMQGTIIVE